MASGSSKSLQTIYVKTSSDGQPFFMFVLPRSQKPFQCGLCSVAFEINRDLVVHVKAHLLTKPFQCGFCKISYETNIELTGHVKTHKLFLCVPQGSASTHENVVEYMQSRQKDSGVRKGSQPGISDLNTEKQITSADKEEASSRTEVLGQETNGDEMMLQDTEEAPPSQSEAGAVEKILSKERKAEQSGTDAENQELKRTTSMSGLGERRLATGSQTLITEVQEDASSPRSETSVDTYSSTNDALDSLEMAVEDTYDDHCTDDGDKKCLAAHGGENLGVSPLRNEDTVLEQLPASRLMMLLARKSVPTRTSSSCENFMPSPIEQEHKGLESHEENGSKYCCEGEENLLAISASGSTTDQRMLPKDTSSDTKKTVCAEHISSHPYQSEHRPVNCSDKSETDQHHQNTRCNKDQASRPFVCSLCGHSFEDAKLVGHHFRSVHNKGKDQSLQCFSDSQPSDKDRISASYGDDRHCQCYSASKSLECYVCEHVFKFRHDLSRHILTVHSKNDLRIFECGVCGHKFKMAHHLKDHFVARHSNSYSGCRVCSRKFKRIHYLQQHPNSCPFDDLMPESEASPDICKPSTNTLVDDSLDSIGMTGKDANGNDTPCGSDCKDNAIPCGGDCKDNDIPCGSDCKGNDILCGSDCKGNDIPCGSDSKGNDVPCGSDCKDNDKLCDSDNNCLDNCFSAVIRKTVSVSAPRNEGVTVEQPRRKAQGRSPGISDITGTNILSEDFKSRAFKKEQHSFPHCEENVLKHGCENEEKLLARSPLRNTTHQRTQALEISFVTDKFVSGEASTINTCQSNLRPLKWSKHNSVPLPKTDQHNQATTCGKDKTFRPFACSLCGSSFEDANDVSIHIRRIHRKGKKQEHLLFASSSHFSPNKEAASHVGDGERSTRSHGTSDHFQCEVCDRVFKYRHHLGRHALIVHYESELRLFECGVCGHRFKLAQHLKYHFDACHGNGCSRPHQCQICGQTFTLLHHQKQHTLSCLSSRVSPNVSGDPDESGDTETEDLPSSAVKSKHTFTTKYQKKVGKKQATICHICGKIAYGFTKLKAHILAMHSDLKPYQCKLCPRAFKSKNSYSVHLKTHTKEKPFMCDICGRSFATISTFKCHQHTHTNERPYKCETCQKGFNSYSGLGSHRLRHKENKRHTCDKCGKKFYTSNLLKRHVVTHTDLRPLACKKCGKTYRSTSSLKYHMTHAHPK